MSKITKKNAAVRKHHGQNVNAQQKKEMPHQVGHDIKKRSFHFVV